MRTLSRREQQRQATRARILAAAGALFAAAGVDATTIEDIAAAADVAKGTFYYHYGSKDEVVGALVRDSMGHVSEQALAALADGVMPLDALRDFLLGCARWAEENRHLVRLPMSLSLGPGAPGEARAGEASFRRLAGELLMRAQLAGQIRGDVSVPELAGLLALHNLLAVMIGTADPVGGGPTDRMMRYYDLFLHCVRSQGGADDSPGAGV